jgi:Cu(I)/Ag(I) efflux system protein CusF
MKTVPCFASLLLVAAAIAPAHAQTQSAGQAAAKAPGASAPSAWAFATGEVINVYAKEKKVLLKHGPIPSIGMGPMTMEYGLTDPKMLGAVKAGDKVRFSADQVKGQYVVTRIEVAK